MLNVSAKYITPFLIFAAITMLIVSKVHRSQQEELELALKMKQIQQEQLGYAYRMNRLAENEEDLLLEARVEALEELVFDRGR